VYGVRCSDDLAYAMNRGGKKGLADMISRELFPLDDDYPAPIECECTRGYRTGWTSADLDHIYVIG
jgi:hypothetical protein